MFDQSDRQSAIFRTEAALSSTFDPETVCGRDAEIEEIVAALQPIAHREAPEHLLVHGPDGMGKTTVVKHVCESLEEETRVRTVYINCWQYNTRPALLSQLLIALGFPAPRKGKPVDELFDRVREWLDKNRCVVIVLDNSTNCATSRRSRMICITWARQRRGNSASCSFRTSLRRRLIWRPAVKVSWRCGQSNSRPMTRRRWNRSFMNGCQQHSVRERSLMGHLNVWPSTWRPTVGIVGVPLNYSTALGESRVMLPLTKLPELTLSKASSKHVQCRHSNHSLERVTEYPCSIGTFSRNRSILRWTAGSRSLIRAPVSATSGSIVRRFRVIVYSASLP